MRAIERPAVQLPTLYGDGKGAKQAARDVAARQGNPDVDLAFPGHWNECDVRGALHAMQGFACAYCQSELGRERGEVEHFRPKKGGPVGGYFWLAYEFSNLLLSCRWCNNSKGDRFPLLKGMAHATYTTRNTLVDEVSLLPDPTIEPVDEWFELEWENAERRGELRPKTSLDAESIERQKAEKMLAVFGINTETALVRARIQALHQAKAGYDARNPELLRPLACRYLPHGAIVYSWLKAIRPELLPTPQDELRHFLEELFKRWEDATRLLKAYPNADNVYRDLNQLHWAFAVIWACPPRQSLSRDEIKDWLESRKLLRLVSPLYRRLVPPAVSS